MLSFITLCYCSNEFNSILIMIHYDVGSFWNFLKIALRGELFLAIFVCRNQRNSTDDLGNSIRCDDLAIANLTLTVKEIDGA